MTETRPSTGDTTVQEKKQLLDLVEELLLPRRMERDNNQANKQR